MFARLVQPLVLRRAAPIACRHINNSARKVALPQMTQRIQSRVVPRHFAAVATSELHEGIHFGELLTYLEIQYGLAAKFVQGELSELAQILGYSTVAQDTMINDEDAELLMEEIGIPPVPVDKLKEDLSNLSASASPNEFSEDLHDDAIEEDVVPAAWQKPERPQNEADSQGFGPVVVSRSPRLFRR
eukprot:TRINITY_DN37621_c0_g1_i1.p1 TRINITY_DN37621_c0_g1~~TRINITY_DN37621_c0_g1_i1.p1  ORF type:complete len:203 (-),score=38.36 TRINITY_DN37621_c0_g1_i1:122-682(-)